jgi:hypothetical protein
VTVHRPAGAWGLNLVCGPASPLPETHQRYRLTAHLGSGGQAEVYQAVRVTGAVMSAPVTVKIFRIDPGRPLADELRSWDKGDAVLMDLNNRGVPGICRRSDGFYGPPPHAPEDAAPAGDPMPYQVYEYLHGVNLREYVTQRGSRLGGRLNGLAALRTIAAVLVQMHHPRSAGATPALHMDIKPANIMVLEQGDVRLIDFTGARYWCPDEITRVSYTPGSGAPEASRGVAALSPAYDVHGFGAVAYFLVTGAYPRVDAVPGAAWPPAREAEAVAPPWSVLRRHPALESVPEIRDHLYAPVADFPADRPETAELAGWIERLGELARRYAVADIGVDWREPGATSRPATAMFGASTATGRAAVGNRAGAVDPAANPGPGPAASPKIDPTAVADAGHPPPAGRASGSAPVAATPRGPRDDANLGVDRTDPEGGEAWRPPPEEPPGAAAVGWRMSAAGAMFAFVCWGVWAVSNGGPFGGPLATFLLVLAVAWGVFGLCRLLGRLLLVHRLGRVRRTARLSHAATGLFLAAAGVAYLQQIPWVVSAFAWLMQTVQ